MPYRWCRAERQISNYYSYDVAEYYKSKIKCKSVKLYFTWKEENSWGRTFSIECFSSGGAVRVWSLDKSAIWNPNVTWSLTFQSSSFDRQKNLNERKTFKQEKLDCLSCFTKYRREQHCDRLNLWNKNKKVFCFSKTFSACCKIVFPALCIRVCRNNSF